MSGTIVDDHRVLPGDRTAADRTLLRRPATPRNRIPAFRSWHGRQRDWALVALVALLGAGRLVLLNYLDPLLTPLWSELVLGLLSTSLLLWRRRMPTAVAVAQVPLTLFSGFAGCAGAVGLFTVAARRRLPIAFAVGLLSGLACYVNLIYTAPYLVRWQSVSAIVAASVAVISWGRLVRARSELVDSLTERAVRAECEQALRIEQAKRAERARITSEMHDVLAQRMSMLSMQASALEVTALSSP
ncbi:MAG: histidine kinase, partial [Sciscionella sp.]